MGLHVGVLGAEQLAGAVPRQVFHDVHALAATVVSLSGVAFSVFVGQMGAHRGQHRRAHEVFGSDQLNVLALPIQFKLHCIGRLGIGRADGGKIDHGAFLHTTDRVKTCALPLYMLLDRRSTPGARFSVELIESASPMYGFSGGPSGKITQL
jgi:hypothetical protein